jgi:hypothetical protein
MRPMSTRLPGTIRPVFSSSAISGPDAMMRSAGSPDVMISRNRPVEPTVNLNVWPLACA